MRNGEVKDSGEKKRLRRNGAKAQTDWGPDTPCACQAEYSFSKVSICNEKIIVDVKQIWLLKRIEILYFC